MLHDYDIFEKLPDGSTIWRVCIFGEFETRRKLQELAEHSENEFFAIDLKAGEPLPAKLAGGSDQIRTKAASGG